MIAGESPVGMPTTLYPFQQRSLAKLLARELMPALIPARAAVELPTMDGRSFYLAAESCEASETVPMVRDAPASLLAETMGAGKTVVAIGLLLATRGQLAWPDERERPTMRTEVVAALDPHSLAASLGRRNAMSSSLQLSNVVLENEAPHLGDRFGRRTLKPSYTYRPADRIESRQSDRLRRRRDEEPAWTIRLVAATLVVVPDELLQQWSDELKLHTARDVLKILVIRDKKDMEALTVDGIAAHDLVLTTTSRLATLFERRADRSTSAMLLVHWRVREGFHRAS